MPINRNALIRYKTIDKCLQNRYRKWTLEDLIDACSDVLYDYEGINKGVSKRTVQADIQMMRSDKLGYNAPIIVVDKKYYAYENPDYSITNIPITEQDLDKLYETVEFLKQFKGFTHFKELDSMVQKLEDHVYSQKISQKPVIDFEKNENLKGLEFLDRLYQSIIHQKALTMTYQSFKARSASSFDFHPYLLKEFRNRWFIIGAKRKNDNLLTLALDRIISIQECKTKYIPRYGFDAKTYFKNVIGVTVSPTIEPEQVLLFITNRHAPYVLTKPLHPSQKLLHKDNYGITISLELQHNFELEKEILSLGDGIKVIAPARLKRNIKERLYAAMDLYDTEISENGLKSASGKLKHKGYSVFNFAYTKREIKKIESLLSKYCQEKPETSIVNKLLHKIPTLSDFLLNKNLKTIIKYIDNKAFLTKAICYQIDSSDILDDWHQDKTIYVSQKLKVNGFANWKAENGFIKVEPISEILNNIITLYIMIDSTDEKTEVFKLYPGSHTKTLTSNEIDIIVSNSVANKISVDKGGILLMKPLLLHSLVKAIPQKKLKLIKLEFSSSELPSGLEWAERINI